MYAITGITGKVGGVVAQTLLQAGQPVRAIVRDAARGQAWAARGCEVALADMNDVPALTQALMGAAAVFVLLPPHFDPSAGFAETRRLVAALHSALQAARPQRVVCISTVGAQAKQQNLLSQLGLLEQGLGDLPMPITFLRPAWFMENAAWDVAPARASGVIPSFLQPLERAIPMVATADVGRTAAELLQETWNGHRVVELEGPRRYSPNDIAACLARLLHTSVQAEAVPRETWQCCFTAQGMKNPDPRIRMLDGFNEGWIAFEHTTRKGTVELERVLQSLI
ncbi:MULTISPECIES: NAD(P)H-binding protein [unclassified Polaromonas]|uniref:NmrA family NAD(P)-binding protein n=1 Tax=unclassified Polaromonas TaxID=2638319 RepID=UPI000F078604|nr:MULTISPECIES: NAD(P)H-binding protein [unclassified Polaromonas]AYQ27683.1 NmrA family transcriptional regulator [Polaromonas sp. SP1]QGJ17468.1 NAD(P)H-binding protein [Polaromonas sp. Pch-P]